MKTILGMMAASLAAVVGCAHGSDGATESASQNVVEAAPANLQAKVTANRVAQEITPTPGKGTCKVTHELAVVTVPGNDAATQAIAAALPTFPSAEEQCAEVTGALEQGLDVLRRRSFEVRLNAFGMLSIEVTELFDQTGIPHPSLGVSYLTFDLKTGKQLAIGDLVDAKGAAIVEKACRERFGEAGDEVCPPRFTIAKLGLKGYMPIGPSGDVDELHEWSALDGHVTSPALRAFIAAATGGGEPSEDCAKEVALQCGGSQVDECLVDPRGTHQCVDRRDSALTTDF